ncbi:hypothetical protein DDB_G0291760 [Dictyostelium discoideum AX4]|uniref:Uncharacterized protein n=1 Tax=Dictyostelium discoideum TaxID=44689 RepID=Q54E80_DICDI|nr:hypothetical protein DDB_G0291760 [Dictyostelium discoideum AX4]EAL61576.1 hypothetical protein DDB_G0291760 [Dictyostelium discoideum AX4]|eukprot:XP_629982.1 hypothetical protein DDB_G0291760 [Dictyostelium discoideum AX4]
MKVITYLIYFIASIFLVVVVGATTTATTTPATPKNSISESYFAIRTDVRKCSSCGGFFLREIGSSNKTEIYVKSLNQVSETVKESQYKFAPNFNVVVKGQITNDNTIVVSQIFRLLPKINSTINIDLEIDNFYTTINPNGNENTTTIEIKKLNSNKPSMKVKSIKNSNDDIFFIPTDWLSYKVNSAQSVYTITKSKNSKTTTTIDYMFISLPDPKFSPKVLIPVICKNETVPTYTSSAARCLIFSGCVHPGPCPFMIPVCPDGYTKSSYPIKPNACPHYSCLPSFLSQ